MMRNGIHCFIGTVIATLLCALMITGCGGGSDDASATADSGAPSASQQAVQADVQARMQSGQPDAGAEASMGAPSGHGGAGGESPEMAMMNEQGYEDGDGGDEAGGESMEDMYSDQDGMDGEDGYSGGGGPGYGQQQNGGNRQPSRPADVTQWTDAQMLAAVDEKDATVLQAIQARAVASKGDPAFAQLMTQVLQKSSGGPAAATGGQAAGFGIPGLGSLFGGGPPGGGRAPSGPTAPSIAPGSVPPGGAFYRFNRSDLISSPLIGVDSVEMMIGEAALAFVPQAAQGSRAAAERMQDSVAGAPSGHDAPGGSASPEMQQQQMQMQRQSYEEGQGMEGMEGEGMEGMEGMEGEGMEGMGYSNGGQNGGYNGAARRQGNLQDEELVRVVVRALVLNNSAPSLTTLKSIVGGTVLTPLPLPMATQIVLAEIFSAEQPNLAVASELLTTATQAVTRNPVENQSTMRFLAALSYHPADHFMMLKKKMPPPGPRPNGMVPRGMAQGGMNSNAMMGSGQGIPGQPQGAGMNEDPGYPGGQGPGSGPGMMGEDSYEDGGESGEGYGDGGYPGGPGGARPPGPPPGMLPPVKVSDAGMSAVASVLWNKSSVAAVTSQLDAADSPANVVDVLALASTIPSDLVRHSTLALFEKAHAQGAAGMTASGLFRNVARDPGILAVLKSLPRKRPRKPSAPNINAPAPPADPEDSWITATQDVVLSLRDRLREVSEDPELAYDGKQRLRLHQNAVPERAIKIQAPGKMADGLGDAAPASTVMYYTSCRVMPQRVSEMQKIADHYEKRSKGMKRPDMQKGILWYDGVKVNEDGTRETMDVIIQQVGFKPQQNAGYGGGGGDYEGGSGSGGEGGGGGGTAGSAPQYTIEVIVVVTKDPKAPPATEGVSTASTN